MSAYAPPLSAAARAFGRAVAASPRFPPGAHVRSHPGLKPRPTAPRADLYRRFAAWGAVKCDRRHANCARAWAAVLYRPKVHIMRATKAEGPALRRRGYEE